MFGTYRTYLALLVVFFHLGSIPLVGPYAVHGFFMISGYLMTHIMHKTYGYSAIGKKNFLINRSLRLYPTYWFCALFSILIITLIGEESSMLFKKALYLPSTFKEFFENISLIFFNWFPSKSNPRLSPPTWALTVEIAYYILICFGVSKNKERTIIWFSTGVLYFLLTHIFKLGYEFRYHNILAGSLPFSIGAMLFHLNIRYPFRHNKILINSLLLSILGIANAYMGAKALFWGKEWLFNFSFYANYFFSLAVIIGLINYRPIGHLKKIDKDIGDFSYPIYLFHWPFACLVSVIVTKYLKYENLNEIYVLLLSLILTFIFSIFTIKWIDKPLEKLRQNRKHSSKASTSGS